MIERPMALEINIKTETIMLELTKKTQRRGGGRIHHPTLMLELMINISPFVCLIMS